MEALGGTALALCAKVQVVRFPSGLRPYPAPLTYLLVGYEACARMEAPGGSALALSAKVQVVRFPSGFWTHSAPLGPAWSLSLLDAVSRGEVQAQSIPAEVAERLRRSPEATVRQRAVAALVASVPAPNSTTVQRIRQIEEVLKKSPGNPYAGEALFQQRCAACHRLFFKGGSVGPDLTSYQRDHLGTLLTSILDPSAEIREGYTSVEVETRDGRTLSGFLTDRDDRQITLRGLDGQDQALLVAEVLAVRPTGRSLMPEGLLEGLSDDQLRDFFAFLRSSQPFSR
jgi:putative heme-binding domain-containing protein